MTYSTGFSITNSRHNLNSRLINGPRGRTSVHVFVVTWRSLVDDGGEGERRLRRGFNWV